MSGNHFAFPSFHIWTNTFPLQLCIAIRHRPSRTTGKTYLNIWTIGVTSLCVVQRSSKKLGILRWESKGFNRIKFCNLLRHIVISCQSQAALSTALLMMAPMKVKPATQTYTLHGRTLAIEASLQNYGIPYLTQSLMPWSMCCTY